MKTEFRFRTEIVVGIGDINYGGHLSNDKYLVIFHEGRLRYLKQFGFSEMDIGDEAGLIMSEAQINYKAEVFWGEVLNLYVKIADMEGVRFKFKYLLMKQKEEKIVATGETKMVAFDYKKRKVKKLPAVFVQKISDYESLNSA